MCGHPDGCQWRYACKRTETLSGRGLLLRHQSGCQSASDRGVSALSEMALRGGSDLRNRPASWFRHHHDQCSCNMAENDQSETLCGRHQRGKSCSCAPDAGKRTAVCCGFHPFSVEPRTPSFQTAGGSENRTGRLQQLSAGQQQSLGSLQHLSSAGRRSLSTNVA